MKKTLLLTILFCFNALSKGIEYIEYDYNNIPNIVTSAGIATEIIFEKDEEIEYSTFGFQDAWISQVVKKHILVFKSKDPQPQTNLLVHTNKRDYIFTVTTGNNSWENHPDKSQAVYSLRILYNDDISMKNLQAKADQEKRLRIAKEEAKYKEELAKKAKIEASLKAAQALLKKKAMKNRQAMLKDRSIMYDGNVFSDYDFRATINSEQLIPDYVWDNGKITFLKFPVGSKRGVAYEYEPKNEKNKTSIVNQHTEKNGVLVVHGVYDRLLLRLGDSAVEIRRNAKGYRLENAKKTNIDNTFRYVKPNAPTN